MTLYEETITEIETSAHVAVIESEGELGFEDAAHEIAISYAAGLAEDLPAEVRHDIARCYLGWDPEDDADLYDRHNIPRKP